MPTERIDVLLKMYDEHANQARQHENQRAQMTTIILTIAGAVIGLITFVKIAFYTWPLSLLLIALGIYGGCFPGSNTSETVSTLRSCRNSEMNLIMSFVPPVSLALNPLQGSAT